MNEKPKSESEKPKEETPKRENPFLKLRVLPKEILEAMMEEGE